MQEYMQMSQEVEVEVEDQILVGMLIETNAEIQMKKAEVAEVMSLVRSVDDIW